MTVTPSDTITHQTLRFGNFEIILDQAGWIRKHCCVIFCKSNGFVCFVSIVPIDGCDATDMVEDLQENGLVRLRLLMLLAVPSSARESFGNSVA